MRIEHDGAVFDFAVLFEHAGDFAFVEAGMDAGDEEVGTRIDCTIVVAIFHAGVAWRRWSGICQKVVFCVTGLLLTDDHGQWVSGCEQVHHGRLEGKLIDHGARSGRL